MHLKKDSTLQNGKYRIIRVLGQGGFGITYLAENVLLGRKVAIKEFFPKDYCDREQAREVTVGTSNAKATVERLMTRFIKEARNIARLDHPGIVRIHDVFQENNTAYYVMEYIEGENISQLVKKNGPMPEEKAVGYIRSVADTLDYIHEHNMTHFDVKPANIVIRSADNMPILIDFGLSKQYDENGEATSTMMSGFSHGYSAVELYTSGRINSFSPQTDVYSLGATLFFMLTGQTPPNASEVLDSGLAVPPTVSKEVAEAIRQAMQVIRNKRPQSAGAVVAMLPEYGQTPPPVGFDDNDEEDTVVLTPKNGQGSMQAALNNELLQERDNQIQELQANCERLQAECERLQAECDRLQAEGGQGQLAIVSKLQGARRVRNVAIVGALVFFVLAVVVYILFRSERTELYDTNYRLRVAKTELEEVQKDHEEFQELMRNVTGGQEVFFNDIRVRNDGEDYDGTIYSRNTTYINPDMEAYNLSDQTKTVGVKFYGPNGLSTGEPSANGFSYTDEIAPGFKGRKELLGWGSNTKGHWAAGNYRFEFWVDGKCIGQKSFTVR